MAMPKGDTPQKAHDYYQYLLSHHETERPSATWHVDWMSLAWMWGFVAALVLILLWWVGQYRTTRHKERIYPVDTWGGSSPSLPKEAERIRFSPVGRSSVASIFCSIMPTKL